MMTHLRILAVLAMFSVLGAPPAQASGKTLLDWLFTPDMPDFERRIYLDGKTPHPEQWPVQNWTTERWDAAQWEEARGLDGTGVMDDLYASAIVTGQYESDGMPVLEVGKRFLQLAHSDQSKVAAYIDHVFGVTQRFEQGGYNIIYGPSGDVIGYYSANGLVLE